MRFEFARSYRMPAGRLFALHETPETLARLVRGWPALTLVSHDGHIRIGALTRVTARVGPFSMAMTFRHFVYEPPRLFGEAMVTGPFSKCEHLHHFEPDGEFLTRVRDALEIRLPWYLGGDWAVRWTVVPRLKACFAARQDELERMVQELAGQ